MAEAQHSQLHTRHGRRGLDRPTLRGSVSRAGREAPGSARSSPIFLRAWHGLGRHRTHLYGGSIPHPLRRIQIWLALVNALSVLLGLSLVFAFSSPLFEFYRRSLAEVFFSATVVPSAVEPYFAWSMALIGAATVGWAVTNLFLVLTAFGRGEPWSFIALIASTLVWTFLEVLVSAEMGAQIETVFVLAASVSVVLPTAVAWWITVRPGKTS